MNDMKLMATLWPNFQHFPRFANDQRLGVVRLNSASITPEQFETHISQYSPLEQSTVPLSFDIKGRQLRVAEVFPNPEHLDIRINHPVSVNLPTTVFFKAGTDGVTLRRIEEDGRRLIFESGPEFRIMASESLHIPDPSLVAWGDQFVEGELKKIEMACQAGFKDFFLSYVQCQRDVDEFRELVGPDAMIRLKIENRKGLEYVAREFRKRHNYQLVAARGDMLVELGWPSDIESALRLIISRDPQACVASRILLSIQTPLLSEIRRAFSYIVEHRPDKQKLEEILAYLKAPRPVSCADILELTWLADIGFRNFMLCDEICLNENLLAAAVDAFHDFARKYEEQKKITRPARRRLPIIDDMRRGRTTGREPVVDDFYIMPGSLR